MPHNHYKMARKTKDGSYIISAGEVGMYVVCPESWRLRTIQRVGKDKAAVSVTEGQRLHSEWAIKFEDALTLARSAKLLVPLIILAIIIHVVAHSWG